jgi:hypothetical protein
MVSGSWGFMKTSAFPRRPLRLRALLSGGFGLVLALGAAAASPADAVAGTHAAAPARAAAFGGTWGQAKQVPGLAALNAGGDARVSSVSCAQPGDCAAGGAYTDGSGQGQGFVVDEANGVWGKAEEVPGLADLNAGGGAGVFSVSCARPGDCSAGGVYIDSSGFDSGIQAFVVSEKNGVWGQAEEVPGLAALNTTGHAEVTFVSCARPGDCGAVGHYRDSMFAVEGFVVSEKNGAWGQAEEVPGLGALNTGAQADVTSVSCARPGDCSAGGNYQVPFSKEHGFVVNETDGVWGQAEEVPGLAALNRRLLASVNSVSCAAPGECSAGGFYEGGAGRVQGFVVGETNGVWGQAKRVPGLGALNIGGNAQVKSVSCAQPGDCGAGGLYSQVGPNQQGFVVSEKNGVWGRAEEIPGLAALRTGRFAGVLSLSCASPGDCAAGGFYEQASFTVQGFVVSDTHGVWRRAEEVPGLAALNMHGDATISSVSCAAPGECSAGGFYRDASGSQGFVVKET